MGALSTVVMGKWKGGGEVNQNQVKSAEDALVYITECTLATVSSMATKKSKSKYEYRRQIGIAQKAIDWMATFKGINMEGTRLQEVMRNHGASVDRWADHIMGIK